MFKSRCAVCVVLLFGISITCAQSGGAEPYIPGTNLLPKLRFEPGGDMQQEQKKTLLFLSSQGWSWALFPAEIDINRYPQLVLSVKTTNSCTVYLELKDKKGSRENALIGKAKEDDVSKVELTIPNTKGDFKDFVIDLRLHCRPDTEARLARVVAFSDPSGTIEIQGIAFDKHKESPKK